MPATREQARELRRNMTPAEKILWGELRGRSLDGLKFLRQFPIGPFIADFCCRDRRLIVELDGEVHDRAQQGAFDESRDRYLQSQDYVVVRFSNQQIFADLASVLKKISTVAHMAPPHWQRSKIQDRPRPTPNSPRNRTGD